MRCARSKLLLAALVASSAAPALPARAGDPVTADALFNAAKALIAQKKYADACPKLAASYKLDPALGTLMNLADCHEKQGLLAQAWTEWGEARERAEREKDAARTALAARHRAALEPRLPKLALTVRGSLGSASLFRDGLEVDPSMLGVDLPVEPGRHTITVRRGGEILKTIEITSREDARESVVVDVSDLPAAPAAAPATPSPTGGGSPAKPLDRAPDVLRLRGGVSVNGGTAFYVGESTLPALSLAGRVGVQINRIFSVVYQNTSTAQICTDCSGFDFMNWSTLLAGATFGDVFDVAAGPSADLWIQQFTGTGASTTVKGGPGLHLRLAYDIGGVVGAGPRRRAVSIGLDLHPTFLPDHRMVSLTAGVGGEWY